MKHNTFQRLLGGGLVAASLVGCIGLYSYAFPAPKHSNVVALIELTDTLDREGDRVLATTTYREGAENVCYIKIKPEVYPNCIQHEVMHCFSGDWHEGYDTDDYCYEE